IADPNDVATLNRSAATNAVPSTFSHRLILARVTRRVVDPAKPGQCGPAASFNHRDARCLRGELVQVPERVGARTSRTLPEDDECGDEHPWSWLAEVARNRGLVANAEDLRGLPYDVVLTEGVSRWLAGS